LSQSNGAGPSATKRGGKRPGAGAKPGPPIVRINITLHRDQWERLRPYGVSAKIRELVASWALLPDQADGRR
jgi:hypothetical protein